MEGGWGGEKKSIKFSVIGLTVHSKAERRSILKMKNEAKGHLALIDLQREEEESRYYCHTGIGAIELHNVVIVSASKWMGWKCVQG